MRRRQLAQVHGDEDEFPWQRETRDSPDNRGTTQTHSDTDEDKRTEAEIQVRDQRPEDGLIKMQLEGDIETT